jgi:hypothetical protein
VDGNEQVASGAMLPSPAHGPWETPTPKARHRRQAEVEVEAPPQEVLLWSWTLERGLQSGAQGSMGAASRSNMVSKPQLEDARLGY